MSETVERRVMELLDSPTVSPFGNPIPGLEHLVPGIEEPDHSVAGWVPVNEIADGTAIRVTVRRIGEPAQEDPDVVTRLQRAGVVPDAVVRVQRSAGGILIGSAGEYAELDAATAAHVMVQPLG